MRTTVDCFCGAGGLSCGLAAAGLHVALGIDCDERALSPTQPCRWIWPMCRTL